MIDILSDKYIMARKRYKCELCGSDIEIGEIHNKITYPYNGTLESYRLHAQCRAALDDYAHETGESEWTVSSVMEIVNDKLREEGIEPAETVRDAILQLY